MVPKLRDIPFTVVMIFALVAVGPFTGTHAGTLQPSLRHGFVVDVFDRSRDRRGCFWDSANVPAILGRACSDADDRIVFGGFAPSRFGYSSRQIAGECS